MLIFINLQTDRVRYILIETFEDLKTSIRFLFSGIYDSQNFLIQHGSTFVKAT